MRISGTELYQDVYTILNWITLTIWTICAFKVVKNGIMIPESAETIGIQKE